MCAWASYVLEGLLLCLAGIQVQSGALETLGRLERLLSSDTHRTLFWGYEPHLSQAWEGWGEGPRWLIIWKWD